MRGRLYRAKRDSPCPIPTFQAHSEFPGSHESPFCYFGRSAPAPLPAPSGLPAAAALSVFPREAGRFQGSRIPGRCGVGCARLGAAWSRLEPPRSRLEPPERSIRAGSGARGRAAAAWRSLSRRAEASRIYGASASFCV